MYDKIDRLIHAIWLFNALQSVGAPSIILDNQTDSVNKKKEELIGMGFDVEGFLSSDKFQAQYLVKAFEQDSQNTASDRCGRCLNLFHTGGSLRCSLGIPIYPDVCRMFQDSNYDFFTRLQGSLVGRCYKCKNRKEVPIDGLDFPETRCGKGCNMLELSCVSFVEEGKVYL